MAIRLPSQSELEERACEAYKLGNPAHLAKIVRTGKITLASTWELVASIVDGATVPKKPRGRKPDPLLKTLTRELLIRDDYRLHQKRAETSIILERLEAAIKAGLVPRGATLPLMDDEGNFIRVPTPKGWKNTGGSAKERALRSVGQEYRLSPERVSEIVYRRKREKT